MYGWGTKHLKGEGDGSLILEAPFQTEDPEALRCFQCGTRPREFTTIPRFAAAEAGKCLERVLVPAGSADWSASREEITKRLAHTLNGGGMPLPGKVAVVSDTISRNARVIVFEPEPGIVLTARQESISRAPGRIAVLLDFDGRANAHANGYAAQLRGAGWSLVTLDLRATGIHAPPGDRIGRAPDHNSAEWSLWIGRPLVGQWVLDVQRLIDALLAANRPPPREIAVVGTGSAGIVAICAGALDRRITHVVAAQALASYVSDVPYENQRLGIMVPRILRAVSDIPHLASLLVPRRLVIADPVTGAGRLLPADEAKVHFNYARRVYSIEGAERSLRFVRAVSPAVIARSLD